jgi:hypothetical protein
MNLTRENEYLQEQAQEAMSAMGNAMAQAGRAVHPRHWTAPARWTGLGASAAAGFVAGWISQFTPRHNAGSPSKLSPQPTEGKHHLLATAFRIVLELAAIARPILRSMLSAYLAHPSGNGHSDAAPVEPTRSGSP